MLDGIYKGTMDTPMGNQEYTLTLKTDGTSLSGVLELMGARNEFSNGSADGDTGTYGSTLKSPVGVFPYQSKVEVEGDTIKGQADTPLGLLEFIGTRA